MKKEYYTGIYRGVVEDIEDPLELGRCRIRVPSIHGDLSKSEIPLLPWARYVSPLPTGVDKGLYIIPEVGDIVWVMFEGGSKLYPIYLGSTYGISNGINEVPLNNNEDKIKSEVLYNSKDFDGKRSFIKTTSDGFSIGYGDSKILLNNTGSIRLYSEGKVYINDKELNASNEEPKPPETNPGGDNEGSNNGGVTSVNGESGDVLITAESIGALTESDIKTINGKSIVGVGNLEIKDTTQDVRNLETRTQNLETRTQNVEQRTSNIEIRIQNTEKRVNTDIPKELVEIRNDITTADSKASDAKSIATQANTNANTALAGFNTLNQLTPRVANLEQQANVNIPTTITNLTSRVSSLDSATGRVANLETTVLGISNDLNAVKISKANKSDLNALDERVTTLEDSSGGIKIFTSVSDAEAYCETANDGEVISIAQSVPEVYGVYQIINKSLVKLPTSADIQSAIDNLWGTPL